MSDRRRSNGGGDAAVASAVAVVDPRPPPPRRRRRPPKRASSERTNGSGSGGGLGALAACCVDPCRNPDYDALSSLSAAPDAADLALDGPERLSLTMAPDDGKNERASGRKVRNGRRSAGALLEEEDAPRGKMTNGSGGGRKTTNNSKTGKYGRSSSHPNLGSLGPAEIIGLALPCAGQNFRTRGGGGDVVGRPHPSMPMPMPFASKFASGPLIDRGDSLVERQASLMSLVVSETGTSSSPVASPVDENFAHFTPDKHKGNGFAYRTPEKNRSKTNNGGGTARTPQDSPALELSRAK